MIELRSTSAGDLLPLAAPVLSVSDAAARGISSLVKNAEDGNPSIIARHGKPVAAVIGLPQLKHLDEAQAELRDIALVLTRIATDDGTRTTLDEMLDMFGLNREELEAELAEDLAAGRE